MKYTLSQLYRAGIITEKPKLYLDIADKVTELKALRVKKPRNKIADAMGISVRTVSRGLQLKNRLDNIVKDN